VTPTLIHLERLVAFDTTNPPRAIDEHGLFAYLRAALPGFSFQCWNHGNGCISLLATRGTPRLLFNFHVDTVPVAEGWPRDPFALTVEDDRAVGLGACDIKGASACMLAACARTTGSVALLFTSDEEAGSSLCIKRWLENDAGEFDQVLVAEPTRTLQVVAHRGIATCTGTFLGTPGHASADRALSDSAVHEAVRWATLALDEAHRAQSETFGALHGIRFNLGRIEGGLKPNMIAGEAVLRFGVRPLPNQDPREVLERMWALAPNPDRVRWEAGFLAPPLRRGGPLPVDLDTDSIEVDFWTEAALFSEAGYPTVVYGPGDIAQAHTVGEWVAVDQLAAVTDTYARLIGE
jgi:acetylornithine deacetylase